MKQHLQKIFLILAAVFVALNVMGIMYSASSDLEEQHCERMRKPCPRPSLCELNYHYLPTFYAVCWLARESK